jgi:hypothetical protein
VTILPASIVHDELPRLVVISRQDQDVIFRRVERVLEGRFVDRDDDRPAGREFRFQVFGRRIDLQIGGPRHPELVDQLGDRLERFVVADLERLVLDLEDLADPLHRLVAADRVVGVEAGHHIDGGLLAGVLPGLGPVPMRRLGRERHVDLRGRRRPAAGEEQGRDEEEALHASGTFTR